jgi:hypothetical protein
VAAAIAYFVLIGISFGSFVSPEQVCDPLSSRPLPVPRDPFIGIARILQMSTIAWMLGIADARRETTASNRADGLPE